MTEPAAVTEPADWLPLREVVAPADQSGVAETIRRACAATTPVYPMGGSVYGRLGARPTTPGIGLSLAGLNRLVDYPARDLTITVEAGMTVARLAEHLAAQRQRLPLDVACADRATIGGVLAAAPIGPRHYRFGSIREFVLGMTAVDGRGEPYSAGGRVVKNATGYDLCRLAAGSLGALGVVTQVTLMVRPAAESTVWVVCDPPNPAAAEPLLAAMVGGPTLPSAIELFGGPGWPDARAWRLAVALEGSTEDVEAMVRSLGEQWRSLGRETSSVLHDGEAAALESRLTEFRGTCVAGHSSGNGAGVSNLAVQANVLPGRVVETIQAVLRTDPAASVLAHAGSGVVAAQVDLPQAAVVEGVARFRAAIASLGGHVVVLSHPGSCALSPADVWGPLPPGAAVMESIRRQFDPANILNPGRRGFAIDP